jgi:hypothetical protein
MNFKMLSLGWTPLKTHGLLTLREPSGILRASYVENIDYSKQQCLNRIDDKSYGELSVNRTPRRS